MYIRACVKTNWGWCFTWSCKKGDSTCLWAGVAPITCHHHEHYTLICTTFPWQYFLQRFRSRIGHSSLLSLNKAITDLRDDCTHCYNELLPRYSQQHGQRLSKVILLSPCINLLRFYFTQNVQDTGSVTRGAIFHHHGKALQPRAENTILQQTSVQYCRWNESRMWILCSESM